MKSIKPTTVASFEEAESIKSLEANVKTATKAFPPEKKQGEADAPPAPPADEAKPAGEQPAVPAEGKPETPAQEAVEPAATEQAETPTQEAHEHGAAGKCPTCGQDAGVILPKPVQDALQALHDSIEGILPGVCANEAGATEPVATAEGDKPAQVSQPGTSQGMAPENHVAPEPAKPTGPEAESKSGTEAPPAPPAEEKKKPPFPPAKAIVVDDKKVTADAVKALLDEQAQTIKAVVEEARVLRERLAKVEGMPASGGPVRRVTEVTNPKQGTESPQVSRQAAIKTLLDDPDLDPALRINLAREDAVLSMNSVFAQGPKGLNGK